MSALSSPLVLAYGAFALGMFSPGPNILAVVGTAMTVDRRAGLALALGVSIGSFLWATMTAAGLTALISAYASLLTAIKLAGGLYLLWLSLKAFRAAASARPMAGLSDIRRRSPLGFVMRGLAIQMTNPKAALTWIAIMSLGLDGASPASSALAIVLGTTILSVLGYGAYAVAFSTARVVAAYGRARRWVDAALGVFFGLAGLRLLASRP